MRVGTTWWRCRDYMGFVRIFVSAEGFVSRTFVSRDDVLGAARVAIYDVIFIGAQPYSVEQSSFDSRKETTRPWPKAASVYIK